MLPPFARSMTGNCRRSTMSPVDDDVGLAEQHHDVAVGMRAGLPDDLHRIVIDIERAESRGERLGRPHLRRKRRFRFLCGALMRRSTFSWASTVAWLLVGERVGAERHPAPPMTALPPT